MITAIDDTVLNDAGCMIVDSGRKEMVGEVNNK
jgi:hypothetical protein